MENVVGAYRLIGRAKRTEPIELQFGTVSGVDPRNHF